MSQSVGSSICLATTERVMCHVSRVTCHMSHVTCHMSRVTCHVSHVTCHMHIVPFRKFHRIGGALPDIFPNVKYDAPEEVGGDRKCLDSPISK